MNMFEMHPLRRTLRSLACPILDHRRPKLFRGALKPFEKKLFEKIEKELGKIYAIRQPDLRSIVCM